MKAITHTSLTPLSVQPSASPNPATVDSPVTFISGIYGDIPPYTYLWDFGDALPTVNQTGLYGYWPLDEASGNPRASTLGTAPDLAESGGAITEVSGRFGNAASSNETETRGLVATLAPRLAVSAGLTIAFWFKFPIYSSGSPKTIFSLNEAIAPLRPYVTIGRYYNSNFVGIEFCWATGKLVGISHAGPCDIDVWHLCVTTYNPATGDLLLRFDDGCFASAVPYDGITELSEAKSLVTVLPADLAAANAATFDSLRLLQRFNSNYVNFEGAVDDLRIWTRVLTDAEIADLWYRSDEETPTYSYGEADTMGISLVAESAHGCETGKSINVVVT